MNEFRFYTESGIVRYCGLRADSLRKLLEGIGTVSDSSIFYHMHHALLRRHLTPADAMNDFARWVWLHLGKQGLAEQLAIVDPMDCVSLKQARDGIVAAIESYIGEGSFAKKVPPGKEFCFLELQSFVFPMRLAARSLKEFYNCLREVGPGSIFHHWIGARIRLGRECSDFAFWLAEELGEARLATQIDCLSPYGYNLWDLKQEMLRLVGQRVAEMRE